MNRRILVSIASQNLTSRHGTLCCKPLTPLRPFWSAIDYFTNFESITRDSSLWGRKYGLLTTKASTIQQAARNSHASLPLSTAGKEKSCPETSSRPLCRSSGCWTAAFEESTLRLSSSTVVLSVVIVCLKLDTCVSWEWYQAMSRSSEGLSRLADEIYLYLCILKVGVLPKPSLRGLILRTPPYIIHDVDIVVSTFAVFRALSFAGAGTRDKC